MISNYHIVMINESQSSLKQNVLKDAKPVELEEVVTEEWRLIQTEFVITFVLSMDIAEMEPFIGLAMTAGGVNQVTSLYCFGINSKIFYEYL